MTSEGKGPSLFHPLFVAALLSRKAVAKLSQKFPCFLARKPGATAKLFFKLFNGSH